MIHSKRFSIYLAAVMTGMAIYLIFERGGMLAWLGSVSGVVLLLKNSLRPSAADLPITVTVALIWGVAWAATAYYVISTWESGEVVDLTVELADGQHSARVWVLDTDSSMILYYDAEPEVAQAMLSNHPLAVIRNGQSVAFSAAQVNTVDKVSPEKMQQIQQMWDDKYGEYNRATDVFFLFLGRSHDRIAVVVELDVQS